jgi:hypothetical protein
MCDDTGMNKMASRVTGYNCFEGSGWRMYGRLVVNFHNNRVVSVYLAGEQIVQFLASGEIL